MDASHRERSQTSGTVQDKHRLAVNKESLNATQDFHDDISRG